MMLHSLPRADAGGHGRIKMCFLPLYTVFLGFACIHTECFTHFALRKQCLMQTPVSSSQAKPENYSW